MEKLLKRAALVLAALAVTACHAKVTSPALWGHQSSAAFDMCIGLWVVCGVMVFWSFILPVD